MKKFIKENYLLILIHIIVFEIIYLVLPFYWIQSDIEKTYSYLFQFSAIFSAIVITAIISKVFSQRQENFKRKEEIINLSNKVSDLRRISRLLIQSNTMWPANLKRIINTDYKDLSYEIYIDQTHELNSANDLLIRKFEADVHFNKQIGRFLLALKSFQGDVTERGLFLYTNYDFHYTYSFKIVNAWSSYNTANCLYTTLDHEYSLLNRHLLLANIHSSTESNIRQLAKKINPDKYSDTTIPLNKLIANIGTDFDSLYFPRLRFIIYENIPMLSKSLNYLVNSMISIIIFGTLIPITLQSLNIYNQHIIRIDLAIFLTIIVLFLFQFKNLLNKELDV